LCLESWGLGVLTAWEFLQEVRSVHQPSDSRVKKFGDSCILWLCVVGCITIHLVMPDV
jgi:hypothetical protein